MKDILFFSLICAASAGFVYGSARPTQRSYTDEAAIKNEFLNAYDRLQSKDWEILTGTPGVTSMIEANPVLFSSGVVKLIFRLGPNLYEIKVSSFGGSK